jgi:gliding motility-associated-like protein
VGYLDFACDAFMPNAFTPEGNTVNDYFKPYIDTTIVKGFTFIVFSRWGTKIFETTDLTTLGWDGNHNGSPAPEGVYGYLVTMSIQREDVKILKSIKGSFHLMR